MNDLQQENHARDLKIAKNEAKRELSSDIRLSSWAAGVAIVAALVFLSFYLLRR